MMAAQEIVELFCELIAVRLPVIESQRLFTKLMISLYNVFMVSICAVRIYFPPHPLKTVGLN